MVGSFGIARSWRVQLIVLMLAVAALWPAAALASFSDDQRARLAQAMVAAINAEREAGRHPSMAAAVFDRDGVVWSSVVGTSDAAGKVPATPATVYRAGSISKLFSDILLIQLVEAGTVDLDAPVTRYLPTFRPINPYKTQITLRHLLTHTSGLVREPPVGSYFTPGDPGSPAVVASLNRTRLVAEPGTLTKYSNAGLAVVGRVVEAVRGASFDALVRAKILQPAAMDASNFVLADVRDRLAYSELPSYGAPRQPAPQFDIGLKAAGGLNTTVGDLSKFGIALLRGGIGERGRLLDDSTLAKMYQVQPVGPGAGRDFGLGFIVGKLGADRSVGHGGAIYGFTAEFTLLPDRGLGVVTFGTVDGDSAPFRLARHALEVAVAVQTGKALPVAPQAASSLDPELQAKLEGYYADAKGSAVLRRVDGKLLLDTPASAGELVMRDGAVAMSGDVGVPEAITIDPQYRSIKIGARTFVRTAWKRPAPPAQAISSLFGDYGSDHQYIRVYERDGQPYVNIEWLDYSRMTAIAPNVWAFANDALLYPREQLIFTRDKAGRGTSVSLNGIVFNRRPDKLPVVPAANREAARVKVARLRAVALAATPPVETDPKQPSDLASLGTVDPTLSFDIRYAGSNNFLGTPVYAAPVAMLQRPAAEAVKRANDRLRPQGLGLVIHDAYRPWYVTKIFWDATPAEDKIFVADPAEGSRHNRGAAVDLSVVDLATGKVEEMPSLYDEASERSYATFIGGSSRQRWVRETLKLAMEAEGFSVYPYEWWHFDFKGWQTFPIQNVELRP